MEDPYRISSVRLINLSAAADRVRGFLSWPADEGMEFALSLLTDRLEGEVKLCDRRLEKASLLDESDCLTPNFSLNNETLIGTSLKNNPT